MEITGRHRNALRPVFYLHPLDFTGRRCNIWRPVFDKLLNLLLTVDYGGGWFVALRTTLVHATDDDEYST